MNGEPLQRKITITNLQGLHLRPLTAFAQLAVRFQSDVFVQKGGGPERINGKSPLAMLQLIGPQGTELIVETAGPDQEQAMEALLSFLGNLAAEEDGVQNN